MTATATATDPRAAGTIDDVVEQIGDTPRAEAQQAVDDALRQANDPSVDSTARDVAFIDALRANNISDDDIVRVFSVIGDRYTGNVPNSTIIVDMFKVLANLKAKVTQHDTLLQRHDERITVVENNQKSDGISRWAWLFGATTFFVTYLVLWLSNAPTAYVDVTDGKNLHVHASSGSWVAYLVLSALMATIVTAVLVAVLPGKSRLRRRSNDTTTNNS